MEGNPYRKQGSGGFGRGVLTVLAVAALVILYVVSGHIRDSDKTSPDKGASQAEQKDKDRTKGTADDGQAPDEGEGAYAASCDEIGGRNAPVFYKEFLKNPNKFKDARVKVTGWITRIDEDNGQTELQISIDDDGDIVIVEYPDTVDAYQGDGVVVYGEGGGMIRDKNVMGVETTWPVINAKYVRKIRSSE